MADSWGFMANLWPLIRLDEYRDDSIELRRYLASKAANIEFEQRKERALTENHRAGFNR